MLRTAVAELGQRLEDVTFAVDPTIGSYQKRGKLGLRQIVPPRWWMGSRRFRYGLTAQRILGPLLKRYPLEKILDIYGGVPLSKIDALVDVSGFAFTDQWGTAPIRDFIRLAKAYKKKELPVVMLPQGFGPFKEPESREAMATLTETVDRIYARDDVSLRHLRSVSASTGHITTAPDITLFYPDTIQSIRPAEDAAYSCIIPNVRMLDQGKGKWGERYESLLARIGDALESKGERACLLIHDTSGKDVDIAKRVRSLMNTNIEIVQRDDPIALKEFISRSKLVVTSRYHGAVASFASGVPSICFGWSHKYEMLYNYFDLSSHFFGYEEETKNIVKRAIEMTNTEVNNCVRSNIVDKIGKTKSKNDSMWRKVVSILSKV